MNTLLFWKSFYKRWTFITEGMGMNKFNSIASVILKGFSKKLLKCELCSAFVILKYTYMHFKENRAFIELKYTK